MEIGSATELANQHAGWLRPRGRVGTEASQGRPWPGLAVRIPAAARDNSEVDGI